MTNKSTASTNTNNNNNHSNNNNNNNGDISDESKQLVPDQATATDSAERGSQFKAAVVDSSETTSTPQVDGSVGLVANTGDLDNHHHLVIDNHTSLIEQGESIAPVEGCNGQQTVTSDITATEAHEASAPVCGGANDLCGAQQAPPTSLPVIGGQSFVATSTGNQAAQVSVDQHSLVSTCPTDSGSKDQFELVQSQKITDDAEPVDRGESTSAHAPTEQQHVITDHDGQCQLVDHQEQLIIKQEADEHQQEQLCDSEQQDQLICAREEEDVRYQQQHNLLQHQQQQQQNHDTTTAATADIPQANPLGHSVPNAGGVPEYTILTPVTPIRSAAANQMSAAEQQPAHTPTATILTDLDAAATAASAAPHHENNNQQQQHQIQEQQQQSHTIHHHHQQPQQQHDNKQQAQLTQHTLVSAATSTSVQATESSSTNQQDGSSQQYQHNDSTTTTNTSLTPSSAAIKIEPTPPSSQQQPNPVGNHQHGSPLTELTPAAIGTTLSDLTTVQVQQQQQQHLPNHHPLVVQHHHQLISGAPAADPHQHQLHHHQELLTSSHQQPILVTTQQHQQLIGCPQPGAEIIAPASGLSTIGPSNASTSSACSSTSNTGASSTGGGQTGTNLSSSASVAGSQTGAVGGGGGTTGGGGKRRTWNQVNRNLNKTEIAKVYSQYGFRCYLETPISTCRRKEEDRITYINKGEFYGLSLEYIPDPQKPLRSAIVKTVVMLVFREDKPPEEDLKSWQFWHSRQHSAKQRILDADNKNHVNVINQIEEISLNAIAFYWNPIETRSAKLNVAVQCLSTDFSNQKGVKGLPLNLQVDIYDLFTETSTPVFRGYATLLSYCDKGAQRRSRDEERRALKRKMADTSSVTSLAGGNANSKKFEDLYHKPCDRSEFYSMADLIKPPTLYTPSEDALIDIPKQPMSQSSGVSITPISATTPIPSMGGVDTLQYNPQAQQQVVVPAPPSNQQPQQQQHSTPIATVITTNQVPRPAPHSSYSIVPSSDYMSHPPQALTSTTGIGGQAQTILHGGVQQSQHGTMGVAMTGAQQQQLLAQQQQQQQQQQQLGQQHQGVMSQQQQHQQQQQQQHHQQHYHAMGNTLQASYGVMQSDHHQPQQYAILQVPPSNPMHHHHQQQQMIATSTTNQPHPASLDSRNQQHQHQQNSIMMSQTGMLAQQQTSQQQMQQQQQQQQQMHQYQQPVGITTATIPVGQAPFAKRAKLYPDERVLIYAKQADENDFYPLHLSPPSLSGLVYAIEQKYKIDSTKVANIYKKSKKGIRVQMDDEMIRHYCNEDTVQLEVIQTSDNRLEITLVEL